MTKQFEKALVYATRIHGGQFRKKTRIPYIAHILGVTAIATFERSSAKAADRLSFLKRRVILTP